MANIDFGIFKLTRLRFDQLKNDAMDYIKAVYKETGNPFTMASPFAQIIIVTLNLGRMILFYIESSINELNIKTAFHERSIRGLSTLTGHNPSRGMAARGTLVLVARNNDRYLGKTINIPNYTKVVNSATGLVYTIILPTDKIQMIVGNSSSTIEVPAVQGILKYQQATGTGMGLQSFNFPGSDTEIIDNYYTNIYVNNKRFKQVDSILDMGYNEDAVMIKTGASGGVDVFFGIDSTVPASGASIMFEYLACSGLAGNINNADAQTAIWRFKDTTATTDGTEVDLNEIIYISAKDEFVLGSNGENIRMTKMIAPHASRSFVLANETSYEYFLRKLNMFSTIEVQQGFNTYEDNVAETKYNDAVTDYNTARSNYLSAVSVYGKTSDTVSGLYDEYLKKKADLDSARLFLSDSKLDDNTVYLFLVPDITTRIGSTKNYFTCDFGTFKLSDIEKRSILNLIEQSGQQIVTMDNVIVDPKFPRFSINIFIQTWQGYSFDAVKSNIIASISDYLIGLTRRDRIPISDIISLVEGIDGVDSVSAWFDADTQNSTYYGKGNYGIDEYGDIIMERSLTDSMGNVVGIKDLYPVFRGSNGVTTSFTSPSGIEYGDVIDNGNGPINITLRGVTQQALLTKK